MLAVGKHSKLLLLLLVGVVVVVEVVVVVPSSEFVIAGMDVALKN
jgi:hypothetical protein